VYRRDIGDKGNTSMSFFKFRNQPSGKSGAQKETDWLSLDVDSGRCFVEIIRKTGKPSVLDLGYTSAQNIEFFTKLGCKIYASGLINIMIDALKERKAALQRMVDEARRKGAEKPEEAQEPPSVFSVILKSLDYPIQTFDGILCWDIFDFCDADLAADLIAELKKLLKPGGAVLSLFHGANRAGSGWTGSFCFSSEGKLNYKEIPLDDGVDIRHYENRMIEEMFADFSIERFVHLRDTSRIVLVKMKPYSLYRPARGDQKEKLVQQE
jgi:SAM-dependent methyltransferase